MKKATVKTQLLPQSQTAQRFLTYFNHPYKFIEALNSYIDPKTGELRCSRKSGKVKPDWRTQKYFLRPRVLWHRLNNGEKVIGLRFGEYTNYLVIDVDITSPYHPQTDEKAFKNILGALENIGLVRTIEVQSSWSEGIHIYVCFPELVKTFNAACALQETLKEAGFKIKKGQLELFPNAKGRGAYYDAHRLPLQPLSGSFILNSNYEPFTDNIETFLNMADSTAKAQDMKTFKAACKKYGQLVKLQRCSHGQNSLKNFEEDLHIAMLEGLTAAGQTNDLLLTIGCYGVVFVGLDEERGIPPLAEYIVETIKNCPGYEEHCHHKHEIEKRAREVAKSSQRYYWAAGTPRKRQGTYKDNFGEVLKVANGNEQKSANAKQRLDVTLDHIKKTVEAVPTTVKEFIKLLTDLSESKFGKGLSSSTLYKKDYAAMWKPVFASLLAATSVATATTPTEAAATPVEEVIEQQEKEPEKEQEKTIEDPAPKTTPKKAEMPMNTKGFAPCSPTEKSKTPKCPENKGVSHPALYEGFDKGAAPGLAIAAFSSFNLQLTESKKTENQTNQEIKQIKSTESKNLKSTESKNLKIKQIEQQQQFQENISLSYTDKSDSDAVNNNKQDLSKQPSKDPYYEQLVDRHSELKALEEERRSQEYQQTARNAFARVRQMLHSQREKFKHAPPSSPT